MKKTLLVLAIAMVFIGCTSTTEDAESIKISSGYVYLNQGGTSTLDYYNIKADSLYTEVYQKNNPGETLSSYAEAIYQSENYIFITLQGGYRTGDGGKVLVLNKNFKKIAEFDHHTGGYLTAYLEYDESKNELFVSYYKGNYPNSDDMMLKKFNFSITNDILSVEKVLEKTILAQGFGNIKIRKFGDKLYVKGSNLTIVNTSDFSVETVSLNKPITDVIQYEGNIIASVLQTKEGIVSESGYYVLTDGVVTDSLIGAYGYSKLIVSDNRLFGIKLGGSITDQVYATSAISELDISLKVESTLVSHSGLSFVGSSYKSFTHDVSSENFIFPGKPVYGNPTITPSYITTESGVVTKIFEHKNETSFIIVLSE